MKGQQGWCRVAEEEEGQGVALIGHPRPNPKADCSHTVSQQGKMHRGAERQRIKDGNQQMRSRRKEKKKTNVQREREGKRQTRSTPDVKVFIQVRRAR